MRNLFDFMGEHVDEICDLADTRFFVRLAKSVQKAERVGKQDGIAPLLAALYLAGVADAEDPQPDPDVWDVDVSDAASG